MPVPLSSSLKYFRRLDNRQQKTSHYSIQPPSNPDPLDLIERQLLAPAIVKLRRPCRCMISHGCSLFAFSSVPPFLR